MCYVWVRIHQLEARGYMVINVMPLGGFVTPVNDTIDAARVWWNVLGDMVENSNAWVLWSCEIPQQHRWRRQNVVKCFEWHGIKQQHVSTDDKKINKGHNLDLINGWNPDLNGCDWCNNTNSLLSLSLLSNDTSTQSPPPGIESLAYVVEILVIATWLLSVVLSTLFNNLMLSLPLDYKSSSSNIQRDFLPRCCWMFALRQLKC